MSSGDFSLIDLLSDFPIQFSIGLGSFSLIDLLSDFPLEFSTGLGGFSPAIWPFETYQLPYKAKMFSMFFWFSSLVSLIGLGGFSLSSNLEFLFKVLIQDSYSRFPFYDFHSRFLSKLPFNRFHTHRSLRLKREVIVIILSSEQRALKVEVMWQSLTTTSSYPVCLPSRCSVLPYLYHSVGGTSTYKLEEYSVKHVSGIIWDDVRE